MQLNRYIEQTLLRPEATPGQIEALCRGALEHGFLAVCVNPSYVSLAARALAGGPVFVCTVAGFPLGANDVRAKAFEAARAVEAGAREVDMVMNIGLAKAGDWDMVEGDIAGVVAAAGGAPVKVILECCLLTAEEKRLSCLAALHAGARFVKTSTGFSTGGATVEDVRLMREILGNAMKIKAAGGIQDRQAAIALIQAGAGRIGTSRGERLVVEP